MTIMRIDMFPIAEGFKLEMAARYLYPVKVSIDKEWSGREKVTYSNTTHWRVF